MKDTRNEKSKAKRCYWMGLGALYLFLSKKQSHFIRFHAIQSVIYSLIYQLVLLLIYLGSSSEEVLVITFSLACFMWLAGVFYAIISIDKSENFHFPLIGEWAERIFIPK